MHRPQHPPKAGCASAVRWCMHCLSLPLLPPHYPFALSVPPPPAAPLPFPPLTCLSLSRLVLSCAAARSVRSCRLAIFARNMACIASAAARAATNLRRARHTRNAVCTTTAACSRRMCSKRWRVVRPRNVDWI
eukprot:115291-Chlamydomonas_euryale.AAC.1